MYYLHTYGNNSRDKLLDGPQHKPEMVILYLNNVYGVLKFMKFPEFLVSVLMVTNTMYSQYYLAMFYPHVPVCTADAAAATHLQLRDHQ